MNNIYLSLGSNIGEKKKYLQQAISLLQQENEIIKTSHFYNTKPMYYEQQGWFLNCVVYGKTSLSPHGLLQYVHRIEQKLGRKRIQKYGPRTIDIDILFYGDKIILGRDLVIPHPLLHERLFVLQPLCDIAPELIHPVLKKSTKELLEVIK